MEQILTNGITEWLSFYPRIVFNHIRTMGFLYIFFLYFLHSLLCFAWQKWKAWITAKNLMSSEAQAPLKQSLVCVERGVKISREEAVMAMERLGLSPEFDGDGIEEVIGEEEIWELFQKEPSLGEVKEAFDVLDENGDGFIEGRELQRVLWCLGLEKDLGECRRMIEAADENGNGLVDHNEFVKFMEMAYYQ